MTKTNPNKENETKSFYKSFIKSLYNVTCLNLTSFFVGHDAKTFKWVLLSESFNFVA